MHHAPHYAVYPNLVARRVLFRAGRPNVTRVQFGYRQVGKLTQGESLATKAYPANAIRREGDTMRK